MWGVLSTLTLESVCKACKATPKEGMAMEPRMLSEALSSGPCRPLMKPSRLMFGTRELMFEPWVLNWVPKNKGTVSPLTSAAVPPWKARPTSRLVSMLTSMITASTKTCRRRMSSFFMTLCMLLKSLWLATMTKELVAMSAVTLTSPWKSSAALVGPDFLEEEDRFPDPPLRTPEPVPWAREVKVWANSSASACFR